MKNEKSTPDSDYLFVYGTLRLGHENPWAVFLREHSEHVGLGKMRGKIFDLGEYPGAIFDESIEEWVEGDVFRILDKKLIFKSLDEYEGIGHFYPEPDEYVRALCPVILNGKEISCWIYLFNR